MIADNKLTTNWQLINGLTESDSVCLRIEWLIKEYLIKANQDQSGRYILYQDPEGDSHKGGSLQLENILNQATERTFQV